MAKPTKTDGGEFLSRWSRRKRGEVVDEPQPEAPETESAKAVVPEAEAEDQGDPEVVAKLPDIDTMDDSSDFRVFMQKGVPEALRRRALRKLWGVNPVLANLDGLNDYDEDYTQLHTLGRGMKTLYRVGKGFVTDEDDAAEEGEARAGKFPAGTADKPPQQESPASEALAADDPPAQVALPNATKSPDKAFAESAARPRGQARGRRWGARDTPDSST